MALEKQIIPLNLAVPANQKADSNSLAPGTPTSVKNVRYRKANRIDKRTGHTTLTMTDTDSNSLTNCNAIIGTDTNLILHANEYIYDYVEQLDRWRKRGLYLPCETTIKSIDESSDPTFLCDSVLVGGYLYYAYSVETELSGTFSDIYLVVVDQTTNQVVSGPTRINDNPTTEDANTPIERTFFKLLEFNSTPYVFYSDNNNAQVFGKILGPSYTNYLDAEATLINQLEYNANIYINNFDVLNWADTRIVVAVCYDLTTDVVRIRYFDSTLTELTGSYAVRDITSMPCDGHIHLIASSSADRFFVLSSKTESNSNVYYAIVNADGSLDTSATALTMNVNTTIHGSPSIHSGFNAYGLSYNSKDGIWIHSIQDLPVSGYYEYDFTTYQLHLANDGTLSDNYNSGGTPNEDFKEYWDIVPVSNVITYNSRRYQVWHRTVENDSSHLLITMVSGRPYIVAQFLYGRSLDRVNSFEPFRNCNRNFNQISSGVYEFCTISKDSASQVSGLVSIQFDLTQIEFTGVPYGKSVLIAGTNLHCFDGHYVREHGFFHRPKAPDLTQGAQGATAIADGTYSVLFVYEYTDRNGLLHRSAPGPATSITVSGGSGQAKITARINPYSITNLEFDDTDTTTKLVKVIPYRTADGGSIYYREAYYDNIGFSFATQDPSAYNNDPDAYTIAIDLILPEANLTTQPVLYTDSGEIPPAPIPPVKYLTTWNKRIIAAGTPRDESVYYSKVNQTNLIPEFTETLSIGVQELPGQTTGIIGFADKLILSKRGRLYYSYGEGPDNTGQGGDFARFEQILGVSGAVNGKSMAVNKEGLYYKSDKGVFVLSGGLATEHGGALYEDEADTTIIKTISPITSETIRMLTSGGIIEHDTFFGTWSTQTGLTPVDAAIYDNDFYLLASDNVVYKEDRSVFKDGSDSYAMYIETGWISLGQITGYQRLYRILFKATYKSVHTLRISIAYDYGGYSDAVDLDPADAIDTDVYRFIIHVRKQKCQAFRLRFQEIITDGTAGTHESLQFNFIGCQVGIKRGLPKIKQAQRVGMTSF